MLRIVLATARPQALRAFATALSSPPEVNLQWVVSAAEAVAAVRATAPQLVIIDHDLPDLGSLDLVQKLLLVNALVNTAVVSSLPEEEFHEASEGLGILGRLPEAPGKGDAVDLLSKLKKVLGVGDD
jgi:DNA-binding NarL/FixJ family response regulator